AFQVLPAESISEFLRQFWRSRDLVEFRSDGERLREHYRRVFVARRAYPRYLPGQGHELPRYIAIADRVDDRGVVLIRHGEPDDRANLNALGFEPNESWRYVRAEGDLLLHFVARQNPDEFQLVESLLDVADARSSSTLFEPERVAGDQMLLRSRERLSPLYNSSGRTDATRALA
ncbi:MAG: GWxTD domain-containing protein, partial [Gemmatimonadota bacterium]